MLKWKFKSEAGTQEEALALKNAAQVLSKELHLGPLAATVCVNRGLKTPEQVQAFLNPRLNHLTHPFQITDLEKAVDHVFSGQNSNLSSDPEPKKKIRVFTDYDVDGTTGAALLTWFFRDLKFNFDVTQPDRFKDGYGLNVKAIEKAHEDGVDTLITVDCGITNFEAAERAQELGVHLIIIDHHQIDPLRGLPPAFAVIDPHRSDDSSQLKQLCGCALAYYFCIGIRIRAREVGYFEANSIPEPNLKNLLDLVVIATAADMVPLTGDNRILVYHGLEVLRSTQKPGLRALIQNAGIEVKRVSPSNLGFALGPRINASGRMGSAETAYRVLTTQDTEEGNALAAELEEINRSRVETQNRIWDQVREAIQKRLEKGDFSHAVVIASRDWHEGVVGIVASKVTEHFRKPAIVLSVREDGIAKGSVRSYAGCNVLEALHLSKDFLKSYGGHKFAAGLSLAFENVEAFSRHYNQQVESLFLAMKNGGNDQMWVEGECHADVLTLNGLEELEKLAPFGPGNPEPVFVIETSVKSQTVLKGRHLKLKFEGKLEGIWFNAAEKLENTELVLRATQNKNLFLFAGIPELNRFMGRITPTLRIKAAAERSIN